MDITKAIVGIIVLMILAAVYLSIRPRRRDASILPILNRALLGSLAGIAIAAIAAAHGPILTYIGAATATAVIVLAFWRAYRTLSGEYRQHRTNGE